MGDDLHDQRARIHERNRQTARLQRIGECLVRGPRALHPPPELDDFGWLEPDFRLQWTYPAYRGLESIAVYCDNTVNRDEGFLNPVIRHARWDRRKDLQLPAPPAWPAVEIHMSYFQARRDWVSEQIKTIQTALAHAPFTAYGLAPQRNLPDIPSDETRGWFEINTRNGAQEIVFRSPALRPPDPLTDLFFQVFSILRDMIQPIAREGWTETYDHDPDFLGPSRSWRWDGHPRLLPEP